MNLDNEETPDNAPEPKASVKKKRSRKEKKALKKAEKNTASTKKTNVESGKETLTPPPDEQKKAEEKPAGHEPEEVVAKLDPSPVEEIPPPQYTTWEKISPPARRKKQITNMEHGFREVLALVHSMRNNQEVLMESFRKLPEAVDSVKKLADHSAQQADLLKAMNDQMGTASAGDFNKTLSSMDETTKLLLERSQRSEEKLYTMLKQAQRRIAFMTLLVIMLFLGAMATVLFVFFPEKTNAWLNDRNTRVSAPVVEVSTTEDSKTSSSTPATEINPVPSSADEDDIAEEEIPDLDEDLSETGRDDAKLEDIIESVSEEVDNQASADTGSDSDSVAGVPSEETASGEKTTEDESQEKTEIPEAE